MTPAAKDIVVDRAASYRTITPEMLERERARVGKEMSPLQAYIETANADAIRHWAHGTGDLNRLWTDQAYAASTRWKGCIAPPTMVMALDKNIIGAASRGFPGVHGWQLGNAFHWHAPIRQDRKFKGRSVIESLEEVSSTYSGVAYDQTIRTDLSDDTGELVCQIWTYIRRFERTKGRSSTKYKRTAKQSWTNEQIQDIAQRYSAERQEIRGAEPRYVEDVRVGDTLPEMIRGPLTMTDVMAFYVGWGGAYVFAHGYAYEFLRKAPGALPPNESNIPEAPERTHWFDQFAQEIGAPAAFDLGPQRMAWSATYLTNWMGDDGFLEKLNVRLLLPNFHGDLVTFNGKITSVGGDNPTAVEIEIEGNNQLGETVCDATATVILPSKRASG